MNKEILKIFKSYGMKYFWGNYFDSRFYIAYLVSKTKSDLVLDLGCGNGVLLHYCDSPFKVGLDNSFESLKSAKQLEPEMELILGDATNLPFKDNIFPRMLAVQILPELKKAKLNWKKTIDELKRISTKNCEIIFSGNNRKSRHFKHKGWEARVSYLSYKEQYNYLKNDFKIESFGYDPYSKIIMYPLKKILFSIPDSIAENLGLERLLFWILRSKRFLKNGRSYVIKCRKKS